MITDYFVITQKMQSITSNHDFRLQLPQVWLGYISIIPSCLSLFSRVLHYKGIKCDHSSYYIFSPIFLSSHLHLLCPFFSLQEVPSFLLALVAQLDACPTGDQVVVGLAPARLATFFCGDWSWNIFYCYYLPCLTGDQEVAGSTHAGSATFFRGDWSWNIFHGHSRPSADSVGSFWRKNVHNSG